MVAGNSLMSAQAVLARGRGHINSRPASEWRQLALGTALKTYVARAQVGALARSCCCARELPSKPTKLACRVYAVSCARCAKRIRCGNCRQKSVVSLFHCVRPPDCLAWPAQFLGMQAPGQVDRSDIDRPVRVLVGELNCSPVNQ